MAIEMDASFDQFTAELAKGDEMVKPFINRALFKTTEGVRGDAQAGAPSGVSGRVEKLKPNIVAIVEGLTGIVGPRDTVKHAQAVETGRKPGKRPPAEALEKWVRIKMGVGPKEVKTVSFLVARKIGARGTKPQPYLVPAFEKGIPFANMQFDLALTDLLESYGN